MQCSNEPSLGLRTAMYACGASPIARDRGEGLFSSSEKSEDLKVKDEKKKVPAKKEEKEEKEERKEEKKTKPAVGDSVLTQYGIGVLEEIDEKKGTPLTVKLEWGAKAHLPWTSVSWKKKLFEMTENEKLEASIDHKEKGKEKFSAGLYEAAIREYELSLIYARQIKDETLKEKTNVTRDIMVPCYQNIAFCNIKLGKYMDAIEAASDALGLEAKAIKAMFFRGRAHRLRANFEAAKADLTAALHLDSQNVEIRRELQALKDAMIKTSETQKKMFSGVFGGAKPSPTENGSSSEDYTSRGISSPHKRPSVTEDPTSAPVPLRKKSRVDSVDMSSSAPLSKTNNFSDIGTIDDEDSFTAAGRSGLSKLSGLEISLAIGAVTVTLGGLALMLRRNSSK